ncbi:MAG: ATP-dependent DNA helicase RecG [Candidatus Coatesbacteria bacterium]|nr:ATP-dependent DNA helicase RecG [Candidatus Coatesbacteria bacterium]
MNPALAVLERKLAGPLGALVRTDYALAERMPDLGRTILGWLTELEGSVDQTTLAGLREPLLALRDAVGTRRRELLREFARRWASLKGGDTNTPSQATAVEEPPFVDPGGPLTLEELGRLPLRRRRGVGPARAERLARLGLESIAELLLHRPRDYHDRRRLLPLNRIRVGEEVAVIGRLRSLEFKRARRRGSPNRLVGLLVDDTGTLLLTWFNAPYLVKRLRAGRRLVAFGKVDAYGGGQLINPDFELLGDDEETDGGDPLAAGRIVPIYPLTEGLGQGFLRHLVRRTLDEFVPRLHDHLPAGLLEERGLPDLGRTLEALHFPEAPEDPARARRRLAFDGLLTLQLAVLRSRRELAGKRVAAIEPPGELVRRLAGGLAFELTAAQRRVIEQLRADLARERPMNRLLQGDVGSGKTLVALAAMLLVVEGGLQAALMAPTDVLARQHKRKLDRLLRPLGVPCHLVTGSVKSRSRRTAEEAAAAGEPGIWIGTTALIQSGFQLQRPGLVVVDEQHRFGVAQRSVLGGAVTNVLVMTATPIPRSLALTVYGETDTSVLDELPPGRRPVKTRWLRRKRAAEAYRHLCAEAAAGRQGFIVCPLVEESESRPLAAAERRHAELREGELAELRLGLVHGRLDPTEKERAMRRFAAGELDALVATTVIEVGVDVPNATVMIIEEAQQFGLAQLHQLRGRVGRGSAPARCYLVSGDELTAEAVERLKALCRTGDGFQLAELDLRQRGPGELLGARQHGVPDDALAALVSDRRLLEDSREAARHLLENDPELERHPALRRRLETQYPKGGFGVAS